MSFAETGGGPPEEFKFGSAGAVGREPDGENCGPWVDIWNLGTHKFRYDFTIFFIYMNSYMNS